MVTKAVVFVRCVCTWFRKIIDWFFFHNAASKPSAYLNSENAKVVKSVFAIIEFALMPIKDSSYVIPSSSLNNEVTINIIVIKNKKKVIAIFFKRLFILVHCTKKKFKKIQGSILCAWASGEIMNP